MTNLDMQIGRLQHLAINKVNFIENDLAKTKENIGKISTEMSPDRIDSLIHIDHKLIPGKITAKIDNE